MQQNFFAVRNKLVVTKNGTNSHFNENIVAVFQNKDDADAFEKAVQNVSNVEIYSKDELIEKYRSLPCREEDE